MFSPEGLFAESKAGMSRCQVNNHLYHDGSASEGLQYRAAVSRPAPCFVQGLHAVHCSHVVPKQSKHVDPKSVTQNYFLPGSTRHPRRSLLETHIGSHDVCSLQICGQCCCVLVVEEVSSDGETGQQSARFWV